MKIITRQQFMQLPEGAICCEGVPWAFGGWFRKEGNCSDSDYFLVELDWTQFEGNDSTQALFDCAERALSSGESLRLDFATVGRDGCFENEAIYCVLEDADIDALIQRLREGKGKRIVESKENQE